VVAHHDFRGNGGGGGFGRRRIQEIGISSNDGLGTHALGGVEPFTLEELVNTGFRQVVALAVRRERSDLHSDKRLGNVEKTRKAVHRNGGQYWFAVLAMATARLILIIVVYF
jgi:hypothetical protein